MASAFESLANAIKDLGECQNTDHQAEEGQQIAFARTPENLTEEINNIESKFEQLQTAVKEHGPGYAEAVSRKLDAAFESCINLAVFIGGDALDPQLDLDEKGLERLAEELNGLEGLVMAKFEGTKIESDRAWKALCAVQAMSMELRDCSLRNVREIAQVHMSTFKIEHGGIGSSIDIANERIATLQSAKNDIEGARAALEDSRWYNDASKLAANIGFGVLTLGVWSVVHAVSLYHLCTSAFRLEDQSRAIEQQLAENHFALTETQNNLSELESQRTIFDHQHALLHAILDRIPGVEESFKQKTLEIDQLACDVVAKKNVAEPIWKRITRLEDTTTTMTRHAALQKEYADALIDMCALGCIDRRRARIIDLILREVSAYPAVVESEALKSKLEKVNEKRWEILSRDAVN